MDYTLDTNAAKKADQINARIEEKGQYLGVFTRAEDVTSKEKGTKGIEFSFRADGGETADYLTIWTTRGNGEKLQGFNTVMAIMTCMRVKSMRPELGEVEKYDAATGQRQKVSAQLFKELMGKPIGLAMHMEEYAKKDGGTGWKPAITAPYDTAGFTASEILTQAKEATTLEKIVAGLRDRPLKAGATSHAPARSAPSFDDLDGDGIPF